MPVSTCLAVGKGYFTVIQTEASHFRATLCVCVCVLNVIASGVNDLLTMSCHSLLLRVCVKSLPIATD